MAELTSQELDQLEDALDELEGDADLAQLGLPEHLTGRLEEYRGVIARTREELPLVDPPAGSLDHVLDEARASARRPPKPARAAVPAWRRFLMPGLALAGTAAAVLLIVRPNGAPPDALDMEPPRMDTVSAGDAPVSERSEAVADDEEVPEEEASEATAEAIQAAPSPEAPGGADKPNGARPRASAKSTKLADEAPAQTIEPPPEDKDDRYDLLDEAHEMRRRGNCSGAEASYQRLMKGKDFDADLARAGYGLCLEARGDPKAGNYLSNPAQAGFIAQERKRSVRSDKPQAKQAAKSKKAQQADGK